jgi:hypothetical protein
MVIYRVTLTVSFFYFILALKVASITACSDKLGKFNVGSKKYTCKKVAKKFMSLCTTSSEAREWCPLTCDSCPSCADVRGRFSNKVGGKKNQSCKKARKKPEKFCAKATYQEKCKVSCNLCLSQAPSSSPSSSPSTIPSSAPSSTPTTSSCVLKSILGWPNGPAYYGYHNDYVKVKKAGKKAACWYDNTETSWGCTHTGDALIYKDEESYYDETESAIIEDASGGTFHFYVKHYYNYKEEFYYEEDHKMPATLGITVNENTNLGSFSHPLNLNEPTHDDYGYKNTDFLDSTLVTVSCDDSCSCSAIETAPTCEIKAELTFPDPETAPYYGYHADT